MTRRGVLRGAAGATAAAAGLAAAGTSRGQPSFDGWLEDVDNYDGVVDERGSEEVTVQVGVQANGGAFGFGPAAVQVDPGTTVRFEWTGAGGQHNVVDENGADFESDLTAEPGVHFEHTFRERGVHPYFCAPHRGLGMKGAVVVGNVSGSGGDGGSGDGSVGGDGAGGGDDAGGTTVQPPGGEVGAALLGVVGGVFGLAAVALFAGEVGNDCRQWKRERAETAPEGPPMEAAPTVVERYLDHEEFDPRGTAALVVAYLLILGVMWVVMYFVQFLGNGPTVVG